MIKFFRKNYQVFIIYIILYCIISVFSIHYIQSDKYYVPDPIKLPFLLQYQNVFFQYDNAPFIFSFLTVVILLVCGFLLVRISVQYLIIKSRSQFSALFLISISSFAFFQELFSNVLIAAFILIILINRLFGSYDDKGHSLRFLDSGILIGIGSLFYFNLIFFLPFLWVTQSILRQFDWREILYSIIGLLIPFIYLFSGYFILGKSVTGYLMFLRNWLLLNKVIDTSWMFYAGIAFYIFIMIIASFYALKKFATTKVQSRKLYQLFLYLFINAIAILVFIPSAGVEMLFLISVPASVLLSIYFTDCRSSYINGFIFLLLMIAPLILNIIRMRY
ncbi:MAG: hypothetical protein JW894_09760 [Bacteroidales bacterium]|nr:hypothetical protein [Bacteroidales bacterium]